MVQYVLWSLSSYTSDNKNTDRPRIFLSGKQGETHKNGRKKQRFHFWVKRHMITPAISMSQQLVKEAHGCPCVVLVSVSMISTVLTYTKR